MVENCKGTRFSEESDSTDWSADSTDSVQKGNQNKAYLPNGQCCLRLWRTTREREKEKHTFIRQNKRDSHPNIWQAAEPPPTETTEGGVNCLIRCWGWEQAGGGGGQRGISCMLCSSIRTNNREQASCAPRSAGDEHSSFLLLRKSAAHSHTSRPAPWVIDRPHHAEYPTILPTVCVALRIKMIIN